MLFINRCSMKNTTDTFQSLFQSLGYKQDLHKVFEDFLTLSLCALSQNPLTGMSHDEDLYLATIAPYKDDELRFLFPRLFAALVLEMESRTGSSEGTDVLGEFYELHFAKGSRSQYFTPWPICQFMAQTLSVGKPESPVRVLEPTCGSGRMLLAAAKQFGPMESYYGIDIDLTCIKMAAITLFLSGIFHAEVMCADSLMPETFVVSYRTSFLPFGVFKVNRAEASPLWHMVQRRNVPAPAPASADIVLPSEETGKAPPGPASQLHLF